MDSLNFTLARLNDLQPKTKPYTIKDKKIPALMARITPLGIVTLQIRRRPKGQHRVVTVKICKLSDGYSMARIREHAVEIIIQLNQGINPNIERKASAAEVELTSITLESAFDEYLFGARNRNTGKPLSERVKRRYPRIFKRDFKAWLDKPLIEVEPLALVSLYDRVESEHGRVSAAKLISIFSAVWNYSNKLHRTDSDIEPFGKCPTWKLADLRPRWNKTTPRTSKISVDELPRWLTAIREEETPAAYFFEALLLTGARRNEIARLRWDQVDLNRNTITLLNTKNGSDHMLPITRRMKELLLKSRREHPRLTSPFRLLNPHPVIMRITGATEIKFSSHAIRRTFTMIADQSGAGAFAIKAILNHSPGTDVTAAHYAQYADVDDLREPLQAIEDYILSKAKVYRDNVLQVVK